MTEKKKSFIGKWLDKVDEKMEKKAKKCGCSKDKEGEPCCK